MSQPILFDQNCHKTRLKRGKMKNIRDAPWILEAETDGYPVSDRYVDDEEEDEDEENETFCEF